MNKLLICTLLAFALFGLSNAVLTGTYTNTHIPCSATTPAAPGTGWVYCVESGFWIKTDCDTLASWNDDPSHPPKCTGGYAYNWLNLRREVEERVTYSVCPITGSNAETCCPSPKTCHSGYTPPTVCY